MSKSAFGFSKPEQSPGFLLWQVTTMWQRRIKSFLEKCDLTHPQFVILALTLWCKDHNIESTQAFLVKKSKLDKMVVSKSMKPLIKKGFVSREEYAKDTRFKNISLTHVGEVFIKTLIPEIEIIDAQFFKGVDLTKILSQLINNNNTEIEE